MRDALSQIMREVSTCSLMDLDAYLVGAAHDACYSRLHRTTRFAQADEGWLEVIATCLDRLGFRSWRYREGRRDVWCLETSWLSRSRPETIPYARGYFDAEGGIPRSPAARFYIQMVQKDLDDLTHVRDVLERERLSCGRIHNPSVRVDPFYWRFYVRSESHQTFARLVSSWHPAKRARLAALLEKAGSSL